MIQQLGTHSNGNNAITLSNHENTGSVNVICVNSCAFASHRMNWNFNGPSWSPGNDETSFSLGESLGLMMQESSQKNNCFPTTIELVYFIRTAVEFRETSTKSCSYYSCRSGYLKANSWLDDISFFESGNTKQIAVFQKIRMTCTCTRLAG